LLRMEVRVERLDPRKVIAALIARLVAGAAGQKLLTYLEILWRCEA